jgi:hypothetical protein
MSFSGFDPGSGGYDPTNDDQEQSSGERQVRKEAGGGIASRACA